MESTAKPQKPKNNNNNNKMASGPVESLELYLQPVPKVEVLSNFQQNTEYSLRIWEDLSYSILCSSVPRVM